MKKKVMAAVLLLCAAVLTAGCGKKDIGIADLKDAEVEDYVTLPDYKNLPVMQPEKVEITDAYVNNFISEQIDVVSELHELTGTVENGDVVNIDYAGMIDGTAFEGGTAQGQLLEIGSGSFIEGFEEGLIGASVGETKQLSLKFPDNYSLNAELAGKECIFAVKINHILAELTDENVSLVDEGYQNAETYREDAKNMLIDFNEYQYEQRLKGNITVSLITGSNYKEIPESLKEDYIASVRADYESAAAGAGVTLEEYMMNMFQIPAENVESEFGIVAERYAKEGLAIQAIANQEGISVSDEELDEAFSIYEASAEELDKETVRVILLYGKVYDFLVDIYKA